MMFGVMYVFLFVCVCAWSNIIFKGCRERKKNVLWQMVLRATLDYKQPLQSLNYRVILWHPMCIGTLDECCVWFYILLYVPILCYSPLVRLIYSVCTYAHYKCERMFRRGEKKTKKKR